MVHSIIGNGIDYDSGPYIVNIPARSNGAVFNVSIIDDKMLEMHETFSLIIESSSLPRSVIPGTSSSTATPGRATVIIFDDDDVKGKASALIKNH